MTENKNKNVKQHRVVVYMPETDANVLQGVLRMQGKTVSGWFRENAAKEVAKYNATH